ncbi:MAG: GNAT family N-acetyltransferase [Fischerella sp.]|nr:GNAT family N-acetyltransferase [Fischerella sp.]
MQIRPATPADVTAVLPMVAKICALHESWDAARFGILPDPEKRYEKWLQRLATDRRSVFLVAEDQGQLVGFLAGTVEKEVPIYRLQEYAVIHDLWVEPEYRQHGIARQMVMQAIERFQQMKVRQIRLDTAVINEAARRLFASCGFRTSTVEMLMEISD